MKFLSTHSCGVRLQYSSDTGVPPNFYPRTPVECDGHRFSDAPSMYIFLSTHSCGVRLVTQDRHLRQDKNFYPRTPVECDRNSTWRLLYCSHFYPRTPVECDSGCLLLPSMSKYFYPRTPVECDQEFTRLLDGVISISIHALLWSATRNERKSLKILKFLSTHSCGVRRIAWMNMRVHSEISIHALLWSATARKSYKAIHSTISIHALLWSATEAKTLKERQTANFYPRTPVECDCGK